MAKLTLSNPSNLQDESSFITTTAANNDAIEAAMEKTLSRDGTSPNQMTASLDMNSQRIINLPAPAADNDAARRVDIGNAPAYAAAAAASAANAATSETNAAASSSAASASATSAATSATNAATSATNAANSATSAAASATVVAGNFYTFDTSTTMADPGSAKVRFNNATLSSVTALAFSVNTADTGNPSIRNYMSTWGSATATTRGYIQIRKVGTPATFAIYGVTAAVTDNTTWEQVTVSHVASNGTFSNADSLSVQFYKSGDNGAVAGPGASVDSEIALWNGTGGSTLKRATTTGILKGTSGVISAATANTDYLTPPSGTAILKANSGGALANATSGTDYLKPRQTIAAATDLNTVTTPGFYACADSTTTNGPYASGQWYIFVDAYNADPSNYLYQVAIDLLGGGRMHYRTRVAGTWGGWKLISFAGSGTSDVLTVNSIELGNASDTTLARSSAGRLAVEGVTVPLNQTTDVHTAGSIELGHASDTTLSRSSAGVLAVEGVAVPLNSTSAVHLANSYEVGNASDTTISRASAGVIAVEGVNLTSNVPVNSQSAAYTAVLADANTCIFHPSSDNNARTFTIPANASVAYPVGTTLTFVNKINTVTISITTDTLTLAGPGTTGSRTLAANGMATAMKISSTEWIISGPGLT